MIKIMKMRFVDLLLCITFLTFGCQVDHLHENDHFEIELEQQKQLKIEQTLKEIQIAWLNDISKINHFQSKANQSFSFLDVDLESLLLMKKYIQSFSIAHSQTQTEIIVLIDFCLNQIKTSNFTEKELAIQLIIEILKNTKNEHWTKSETLEPILLEILKTEAYPLQIKLSILKFFEKYGRADQIQNFLNPFTLSNDFFKESNTENRSILYLSLWRCFRKCLKRGCHLKIDDLIDHYQKETQRDIQKQMILIASSLQSNEILKWCGVDFWQTDLIDVCEKALSENPSQESFIRLENYLRSLLIHQKKMNLYDIELSKKMRLLLVAIQNHPERIHVLIELSDLFFSKSRSSDSIYALIDLFEEIRPKKEALSLFLRYEKWAKENFSNQPQGLMDRLRQGIRRLYED
jgi:hypothetical protein